MATSAQHMGSTARIVTEVDRHLPIGREVEFEVDLQRAQALKQVTLAKALAS